MTMPSKAVRDEIFGALKSNKPEDYPAALKKWEAALNEILAALAGDPIAISNNWKEVERIRQREREN